MKRISIVFFAFTFILFTCMDDENSEINKALWINKAFESLSSNAYPKVKAISWWHENFDDSKLRIDSSPASLEAYQAGVSSLESITIPFFIDNKLVQPIQGIYHAAYPDFGGTEDIVTAERINDFETLIDKEIAWAYFSNNWMDAIEFPQIAVTTIKNVGKIPFIRMMPRSNFDEGGPDPIYTMQKILDGDFDAELTQWAIAASNIETPLLVEFGTEVNGNWFSWNGQYNGGETMADYGDPNVADGPERFRDAYRHIIDLCRANGANNITWFFHIDAYSEPESDWNDIKNYYPGDDYIDWLGVSVYGPQEVGADFQEFSEIMNDVYPQLIDLADKPIAVLEFAIAE